jgi:uncharacterized protein (DUF1697 family)
MSTFISLLRGINVSGQRMIKMDALKKLCTDLKFEDIQTYIQSGNIIYNYEESDKDKISDLLKTAIEKTFSFDVPVITLVSSELENIIKSNPFLQDKTKDTTFFYITFLAKNPAKENIELLQYTDFKNDKYQVIDKAIYLYCPDSYRNSKLTNSFLESKLKVPATTRNWKTANELFKIANKINKYKPQTFQN